MTQSQKDKLEALGTKLIRDFDNSEAFQKALIENPIKTMQQVGFDTKTATNNELQIFFMDNMPLMEQAYEEVHTEGIFGCAACKIGIVAIVLVIVTILATNFVTAGAAITAWAANSAATITAWATWLGVTEASLTTALTIIKSITLYTLLEAICKLIGFCS